MENTTCVIFTSYTVSGINLSSMVLVLALLLTTLLLLAKLSSGFRAAREMRGADAVVVHAYYFRFVLANCAVFLAQAIVTILPHTELTPLFNYSVLALLSTQSGLQAMVVAFMLTPINQIRADGTFPARWLVFMLVFGLVSFLAMLVPQVVLYNTNDILSGLAPMNMGMFVGFCVRAVVGIVFCLLPQGRPPLKRWAGFMVGVDLLMSLSLFLWVILGNDVGVCLDYLGSAIFVGGIALNMYYSFTPDSKLLYLAQRMHGDSERRALLSDFLQETEMQRLLSNPSLRLIVDEEKLHKGRLLGSGGYSDVFAAEWEAQPVALKCFRGSVANVSSVLHEAETMGRLRHPNILSIMAIGVFMPGPRVDLVFELMSRSLFDAIQEGEESLKWLRETVLGMQYLHANGILHRDLKSSNVLLTSDGTAKVSDFGLSCVTLQTIGTALGTVQYAAPEVLRGEDAWDWPADVWSFGCIMWEARHFEPPFAGVPALAIPGKVGFGSLRLTFDVTDDYSRIMSLCLSNAPADRPSFADIQL